MVDNLTRETRSKVMSSIKGKNTKPEMIVRKLLWSKRKRYRLHNRSVFGTPDISSKKKRVAVFIDGCFWHGCHSCYTEPRTNVEYWRKKIIDNKKRRTIVNRRLRLDGWKVLEFWEHDVMKNPDAIVDTISYVL